MPLAASRPRHGVWNEEIRWKFSQVTTTYWTSAVWSKSEIKAKAHVIQHSNRFNSNKLCLHSYLISDSTKFSLLNSTSIYARCSYNLSMSKYFTKMPMNNENFKKRLVDFNVRLFSSSSSMLFYVIFFVLDWHPIHNLTNVKFWTAVARYRTYV